MLVRSTDWSIIGPVNGIIGGRVVKIQLLCAEALQTPTRWHTGISLDKLVVKVGIRFQLRAEIGLHLPAVNFGKSVEIL